MSWILVQGITCVVVGDGLEREKVERRKRKREDDNAGKITAKETRKIDVQAELVHLLVENQDLRNSLEMKTSEGEASLTS